MSRLGAFAIHLGISLVIFGVLAALVVYVWYPDFFFHTDGGWQGIRIIVLVDLVLGPLLTLIVFDRNKAPATLRLDLALIGTFQAACLVAGTYVVYAERPLALVYVDGSFYSMSADAYREAGVEVPDLSDFPGPWPKRVAVDLPEDPAEQSKVRARALGTRTPLRALSDRYEPLSFESLNSNEEAFAYAGLIERDTDEESLQGWLDEYGGELEDYAFFPYGARYQYVFLGVSKRDEAVVGLLEVPRIDPSEEKTRLSAGEAAKG